LIKGKLTLSISVTQTKRVEAWLGKDLDDWLEPYEESPFTWADEWVVLAAVHLYNLELKIMAFEKGKYSSHPPPHLLTVKPFDSDRGKPKRVYMANWWGTHYSALSKV